MLKDPLAIRSPKDGTICSPARQCRERIHQLRAVIHIPGAHPVAITLPQSDSSSPTLTIVLSVIPSADEPNKPLAIAKVLISAAVLIGIGVAIFLRADAQARSSLSTVGKAGASISKAQAQPVHK